MTTEKQKAARKRWKKNNPEKVKAMQRRWRETHKNYRQRSERAWRLANPERTKGYGKKNYQKHKERYASYARKNYLKIKSRVKKTAGTYLMLFLIIMAIPACCVATTKIYVWIMLVETTEKVRQEENLYGGGLSKTTFPTILEPFAGTVILWMDFCVAMFDWEFGELMN